MRVVVAGLGVQGHKRRRIAGADFVAASIRSTRTPTIGDHRDVPLDDYDAVLACIPDEPKIELLTYCSQRQARAGREAAVGAERQRHRRRSRRCARAQRRRLYTAYNHRFEPHFVRMRDLIASGELGAIYSLPHVLRQRHGAAGARFGLARSRRGRAARSRLASARHLPVLVRRSSATISASSASTRFENRAPDHVVIAARQRAADRARNDAADVAQPFHLRHPRREGHGAHPVAVQMGPHDVHASARACCRAAGRRRRR